MKPDKKLELFSFFLSGFFRAQEKGGKLYEQIKKRKRQYESRKKTNSMRRKTMKSKMCFGFVAILIMAFLVGTAPVVAQEPATGTSVWITVTPNPVVYGHRPMTMTVTVVNPINGIANFTVQIWHGGNAWGKEDYPLTITTGTQITGLSCNGSGCTHTWEGTLSRGAQAQFVLPTFSGTSLGIFEFGSVTGFVAGGSVSATQNVTIVQGTGDAQGRFWIDGVQPWEPGQFRGLHLVLEAPVLTQFAGGLVSTCGIEGLPTNFTGHARTWEEFLWYVLLPSNAPSGVCTITAAVTTGEESFEVYYQFMIPYRKTYLSIITR